MGNSGNIVNMSTIILKDVPDDLDTAEKVPHPFITFSSHRMRR